MTNASFVRRLLQLMTCVLVVLGLPRAADAAPTEGKGTDVLLSAGASFRHVSSLDLAQISGAQGFGEASDTSPGSLSLEAGAGLLFSSSLELRSSAWLGVGGLALGEIERRYFQGGPEQIGSSLTIGAGGSARYAPSVTPKLRLLVGPAIDWKRLVASSPLGSAAVELVGLGLDTGVRYRSGPVSRRSSGFVELILSVRRELPGRVWVGQSRTEPLFSSTGSGGDAVYSAGVTASFGFSLDDVF